MAKASSPVLQNVLSASRGAQTIASPLTLNDVFSRHGIPVRLSNALSRRW